MGVNSTSRDEDLGGLGVLSEDEEDAESAGDGLRALLDTGTGESS